MLFSNFFLLPNTRLVYQSFEASRNYQAGCINQTCVALTPLPSSIPGIGTKDLSIVSRLLYRLDHSFHLVLNSHDEGGGGSKNCVTSFMNNPLTRNHWKTVYNIRKSIHLPTLQFLDFILPDDDVIDEDYHYRYISGLNASTSKSGVYSCKVCRKSDPDFITPVTICNRFVKFENSSKRTWPGRWVSINM